MRRILVATLALAAGCTAVPGTPVAAAPPAPPAACVLDVAALAATTGVGWSAVGATASDTRCVYDPAGGDGSAFVVVDLVAGNDVETPAMLCDAGSRATTPSGGWVCRFGDGVLGADVLGGDVLTVAAASVPAGTDGTRLAAAFGAELDRLAGR